MTLTLLLDLDDTLLTNNMDSFLPAYLKALTVHMAAYAPPDSFPTKLLAATGQMSGNDRPDHSLKATFDAAFYPAVGLDYAASQPVLAQFYEEIFPNLKEYTGFRPEAITMLPSRDSRARSRPG